MVLKVRTVLRAIAHPISVLKARKAIRHQALCEINNAYPHLPLKITRRNLYCKRASYRLKADIFCHHYALLANAFDRCFLDRAANDQIPLWQHPAHPGIQIVWKQTLEQNQDCEIDLLFQIDGVNLYAMGFVFVPLNSVVAGGGRGILISRIQSCRESRELLREHKAMLCDTAPPHLLFAAMLGLAGYIDCHVIYGISANSQSYSTTPPQQNFLLNYDHFWEALSGEKYKDHCFMIHAPYLDKPITEVVSKHRGRTRKKRQLKHEIVASALARLCHLNPVQGASRCAL